MKHHLLTAEAAAQFGDGISLVLDRWAALRMAVENEWGGRDSLQKAQRLRHTLFNFLSLSKDQVYIDDVEDIIYEFMDSLNTEIADGSIEEVAEKLTVMHEECLEGNFDSIKKLRETNTPAVSYIRQPIGDHDEDNSDDEDGENAIIENKSSTVEDDDDYTVIEKKSSAMGDDDDYTIIEKKSSAMEDDDDYTIIENKSSSMEDNTHTQCLECLTMIGSELICTLANYFKSIHL